MKKQLIKRIENLPSPDGPGPIGPVPKAGAALAAPPRRRNVAVMLAGGALVLVAGAIAASVASAFDDTIDVLAADRALAEGEPFSVDAVRVVQVAAREGDIQAMQASAIDQLAGLITTGPIGEGSLVHPNDFTSAQEMETVIVGAQLGPDQYPAKGLKRGDVVRLIEISNGGYAGPDGFATGRDIALAEVVDAVPTGGTSVHFSFRVGESSANVVADRVAQDRLTVALVDAGITVEQVEPLTAAEPVRPLTILETEDAS